VPAGKLCEKNKKFFFCILKVTEEKNRNGSWIRIQTHKSEVRIHGSGSALKCHGSQHCCLPFTSLQNNLVYLKGVSYEEPAPVDAGAQVIRVHGNVTHLLDRLPTAGLQVHISVLATRFVIMRSFLNPPEFSKNVSLRNSTHFLT
jgi:hypothetical protein